MTDLAAIAAVVPINEARVKRCHRLATEAYALTPAERPLFLQALRGLPNRAFARINDNDIVRGLLDVIRRDA